MSSFDIPITVAPKDLNRSVASEKLWASTVQPLVNAFGKKYSTTGPFFRASASANVNSLPPMAARAVNSGARAPMVSAACAPPRLRPATAIPIRIMDDLRVIGCLRGRNRAGAESPAVKATQNEGFGCYSDSHRPCVALSSRSKFTRLVERVNRMGARERTYFELTLKGS